MHPLGGERRYRKGRSGLFQTEVWQSRRLEARRVDAGVQRGVCGYFAEGGDGRGAGGITKFEHTPSEYH